MRRFRTCDSGESRSWLPLPSAAGVAQVARPSPSCPRCRSAPSTTMTGARWPFVPPLRISTRAEVMVSRAMAKASWSPPSQWALPGRFRNLRSAPRARDLVSPRTVMVGPRVMVTVAGLPPRALETKAAASPGSGPERTAVSPAGGSWSDFRIHVTSALLPGAGCDDASERKAGLHGWVRLAWKGVKQQADGCAQEDHGLDWPRFDWIRMEAAWI